MRVLPARRRPERVLDTLTQVVSQALVLRGTRGEAEGIARQILEKDLNGVKVAVGQGS